MSLQQFKQQFLQLSVAIKSTVAVAVGGAAGALSAHFTDPTAFAFDKAGILKMKGVALGGAAIALFHLFQSQPHKDGQ